MSASDAIAAKHKDVNPFLLYKWERIFNAFFDRNAGGDVDWSDFYLVVRHVRDIYGAESDQMSFAKKSMQSLWEGLLGIADSDHNKVISVDEWIGLLKKCGDPKSEPKWFNDYLTYMFKLFDVSADDTLDIAEYTDGMVCYNFSPEAARAGHNKFSVDDKGKPIKGVNIKQFGKLWHEYFYSTDKNALGNDLFGVLP